jgi:uncharacterized repeat protein (TIGR03803 family)
LHRFYLLFVGICLGAISIVFAPAAAGQATEKVLYQFAGDSTGAVSSLLRDSAGNLYGTTFDGGTAGVGTVFKVDPTGTQTVLYNFTGINGDGAYPLGGLLMDNLGNLYGTTTAGGGGEAGTVFKVDSTGKETILYSFSSFNTTAGTQPEAGVIMDSAGNLYGTAGGGGTGSCNDPNFSGGCGVVFKLDPTGKETVLLSFTGSADGSHPLGGLLMDSLGNFYGTTSAGGAGNVGTVFKLDPTGHETVLHAFAGKTGGDGANPHDTLVMDNAGNLYGTTLSGGATDKGVIFKQTSTGQETVLHSFTGTTGDGAEPQAGLVLDSAGNLYGTTLSGGTADKGVIFKSTSTGQETVLHSFTGTTGDGAEPQAGLVLDSAGNLYGTTWLGGAAGGGTIFKLNPTNQETVLYSFTGPNGDGGFVEAGLFLDSTGNLYGTTLQGGTSTNGTGNGRSGDGIVFKLDPTGKETVLHNFTGPDGAAPRAGLTQDSAGNLYGTTSAGGSGCPTSGCGTIFTLSAAGTETVLYSFKETGDGGNPQAGLIQDSKGNLYGTTTYDGSTSNCGTVFRLAANGQLRTFAGVCGSTAGLLRDSAGNLYGTTGENVFKLDSKGKLTVLYSFTGANGDGANPVGDLIMDSAGNLYGATANGGTGCSSPFGTSGCGTVFKLDPTGHETVLYRFTGANGDGSFPQGVIMDSAGNLYGTAGGGANGLGTVFKVDPTGHETILYSFTGLNGDGSYPVGRLVMDSAGKLYGTTQGGGKNTSCVVLLFGAPSVGGCGTVFVVTP